MWRDQKAIERLEDDLRALKHTVDDLDRARKSLEMEFTELYDKVSHQMSRMAKRQAVASKEPPTEETEIASANSLDGIDPISKSIMLRRGMGGTSSTTRPKTPSSMTRTASSYAPSPRSTPATGR